MRITFMMSGFTRVPSGSHRVVYEYANALTARGHDVWVLYPRSLPTLPAPTGLGVKLRQATRNLRRRFERAPRPDWFPLHPQVRTRALPDPGERWVPDSDVIVATWWLLAEYIARYPVRCGRGVYIVHHDEAASGHPRERVEATWRLPLSKIAVSRATEQMLLWGGATDVHHVPNGLDTSVYRPATPPEERPLRVAMAWVGKAIKDPETGLRALAQARARIPDLDAVFFGSGRGPWSRPGWVTYRRRLPTDRLVREVYGTSAIFLCSSRLEGFGLPVAEAMACGCAVVTTDCGGVRDFAEDGETALLSPPSDAGRLADNVVRLLSDSQLRLRLARAGRARVAGFTWQRSADEFERALGIASAGR